MLDNEKEILTRIAEGDQKAFALLIDQYSATVYKHVLTYLKNALRAEEITQDIFMNVWKHRSELPAINNFAGYLFVLTRNRTNSAFREKLLAVNEPKDELESNWLNPANALEYRELSETLRKAIELLPPRRKEVFTRSRFESKSYEEIAIELGISKSAVNKHIIEALVFLRTYMASELCLFIAFITFCR
jgi:RNA polymerase sigma-70 factor (family 1)